MTSSATKKKSKPKKSGKQTGKLSNGEHANNAINATANSRAKASVDKLTELLKKQEPLHRDLRPYVEQTDVLGPGTQSLRHPLIYDVLYIPSMNAMLNARYKQTRKRLKECKRKGDWAGCVWSHERAYRFEALARYAPNIADDREFWELFGSVWTDSENIWQNVGWLRLILASSRAGREYMMDDEEREKFAALPDTFTVYRGHQFVNERGYSWTLDRAKAQWFAKRLYDPALGCAVAERTVQKSECAALLLGRGEQEIVIFGELAARGR